LDCLAQNVRIRGNIVDDRGSARLAGETRRALTETQASQRLQRARHRVQLLQNEIDEYYAHFHISSDLLELRNLVTNADLIVQSALSRHESRGLHYSRDYPETLDNPLPTILTPPNH